MLDSLKDKTEPEIPTLTNFISGRGARFDKRVFRWSIKTTA